MREAIEDSGNEMERRLGLCVSPPLSGPHALLIKEAPSIWQQLPFFHWTCFYAQAQMNEMMLPLCQVGDGYFGVEANITFCTTFIFIPWAEEALRPFPKPCWILLLGRTSLQVIMNTSITASSMEHARELGEIAPEARARIITFSLKGSLEDNVVLEARRCMCKLVDSKRWIMNCRSLILVHLRHNYNVVFRGGGSPLCLCGEKTVVRTARTVKNRGKQFWGCPMYKNGHEGGCNFFKWCCDDASEKSYTDVKWEEKHECHSKKEEMGGGTKMMSDLHKSVKVVEKLMKDYIDYVFDYVKQ
ncbi:hypothetical protein V8G54_005918 [Vigna mungo]|uniref:GRF-type domain-containing protein n=1 Tax=Vigna mungo TaxID=3915 RepID=A0AAQ3NY20_VIGMU